MAWAITCLLSGFVVALGYFHAGKPTRLNVVSVMFWSHLCVQVVPAFHLYLNADYPEASTYLFASCLVALLIPLGALLSDLVFPRANTALRIFYERSFTQSKFIEGRLRTCTRILLAYAGLITIAYISTVPGWPIYQLLTSQAEMSEVMAARRAASTAAMGYAFTSTRLFLMPFAVALAVAWWMRRDCRRAPPRLLLATFLVIAVIYNSYSAATTATATLAVVGALAAWHCLVQRASALRISSARLWLFPGMAVLVILAYPIFLGLIKPIGDLGLAYILQEEILSRLTTKVALNTYLAFEIFPTVMPYTWFADIGDIAALTGREFINTGTLFSVYKGQGQFNQAPPATLGTFYAQGGWSVVVLGFLTAAFIFRALESWICRSRIKTPIEVALHAILLFGAFRVAWSKFHYVLFSETILPVLLMLAFWRAIRICATSAPLPRLRVTR